MIIITVTLVLDIPFESEDFFIGGVIIMAARVADFDLLDSCDRSHSLLSTPEASHPKDNVFHYNSPPLKQGLGFDQGQIMNLSLARQNLSLC